MSRAKSLHGLRGNARFILKYKTWATLALMGLAFGIGIAMAMVANANAHSGMVAKDGCHRDKARGERHWHYDGGRERAGQCLKVDGQSYRIMPCERCLLFIPAE